MATKPASQKSIDTFLEQYKTLEVLLRTVINPDMTILNYEEKLTPEQSSKLRIIRQIRNFIQHNPETSDFIIPTDAMTEFLKSIMNDITAQQETTDDKTYKLTPLKTTMMLRAASKTIIKSERDWFPIVDEKKVLVGVTTCSRMLELMTRCKLPDTTTLGELLRKTELTQSLNDHVVLDCTDSLLPYIQTKPEIIITRNGKYSGVINWSPA